jgi:hypothetical protein
MGTMTRLNVPWGLMLNVKTFNIGLPLSDLSRRSD